MPGPVQPQPAGRPTAVADEHMRLVPLLRAEDERRRRIGYLDFKQGAGRHCSGSGSGHQLRPSAETSSSR